jgi:hypothetical protein
MSTEVNSPTPNIPLLRKSVEWVESQAALPEIDREWDQARYICQPDMRARVLIDQRSMSTDYYQLLSALQNHCGTTYCVAGYIGQLEDERYCHHDMVNGIHVAEFAQKQLGLTEGQSQWLFSGENTAADVRRIAESIAGEAL